MNRRTLLSASGLTGLLLLAGCNSSSTPAQDAVTLDQAKAYMDAGVAALEAAAQQYKAGPPAPSAANAALVTQIAAQLLTVKAVLDQATAPTDWKTGALEAIGLMQQLLPPVGPFLGAAAQYIPLAIAVIQAFIAALPPPSDAPATPPAALSRKALEYRQHR